MVLLSNCQFSKSMLVAEVDASQHHAMSRLLYFVQSPLTTGPFSQCSKRLEPPLLMMSVTKLDKS